MEIIPSSASRILGLDLVDAEISGRLRTEMGAAKYQDDEPSSSRAVAAKKYSYVWEIQDALANDSRLPLDELQDPTETLRRARPIDAVLDTEAVVFVRNLLQTGRFLKSYFSSRGDQYPSCLSLTAGIPSTDCEKAIDRVLDPSGNIRDDASTELKRLRRKLLRARSDLERAIDRQMQRAVKDGLASDGQPTIRNGRMVLPLKAEAKRKIKGFVHDVSSTGLTVFVEPADCLDLNNEIAEAESAVRNEERRLVAELTTSIRDSESEIIAVRDIISRFDVMHAKAEFGNSIGGIAPQLHDDHSLSVIDARNPQLLLRPDSRQTDIVPLSLELGKEYRSLIITGPNAGGKTVAAKTIGLLLAMISRGIPVPVDEASTFFLPDQLFIDIGDEQSVESDLSTFSSHAFNWKTIVNRATNASVVILDELGSATDPHAGGAIARSLIETLTERGSINLVTTHIGALKTLAEENPLIENGSMQFDNVNLVPTYELKCGLPGSSYAFEILDRIGLDSAVVEKGRELAGDESIRLESVLASLQEKEEKLQIELQKARDETIRAKEIQERISSQEESLDELIRDKKEKALMEADEVLSRANREIERTIREIRESNADKVRTKVARSRLVELGSELSEERRKVKKTLEVTKLDDALPEIGDQVRVVGQKSVGEFLEQRGTKALIAFDSIQMTVELDQLERVGKKPAQKSVSGKIAASGPNVPYQLDVRGMRVDEAIKKVERYIDDAARGSLQSVRILHGTGTGALRKSIRDYLSTRSEVTGIAEAEWNQGGAGVSEVTLV